MMKKVVLAFVFLCSVLSVQAQLAPGDLVVIGFNSDNGTTDDYVLLALADIPAGEVIFISDRGWETSSDIFFSNNTTESALRFVVGAGGISAGTILRSSELNPTFGTLTLEEGTTAAPNLNIDSQGDQIIIYQTDDDTYNTVSPLPTFIYALNIDDGNGTPPPTNGWRDSGTTTGVRTSHLPNGMSAVASAGDTDLAYGFGALNGGEVDNAYYSGLTTPADKNTMLARLHDPSNWTSDNDNPYDFTGGGSNVFNGVTFSVTSAATDYFRTTGDGDWTNTGIWETSTDGVSGWTASTLAPDNQAASIQINHTIDVTSDETAHNLKVNINTGQLRVRIGNELRIKF